MPRAPASRPTGRGPRGQVARPQASLAAEIEADRATSKFGSVSLPGRRDRRNGGPYDDEEGEDAVGTKRLKVTGSKAGGGKNSTPKGFVDARLSANILKLAREEQEEMEREAEEQAAQAGPSRLFDGATREGAHRDAVGSDEDEDEADEAMLDGASITSSQAGSVLEETEEMDPTDAALLAKFAEEHGGGGGAEEYRGEAGRRDEEDGQTEEGGGQTLADIIMAKIKEAEARGGKTTSFKLGAVDGEEAQEDAALNSLPPGVSVKVGEAYTKVGMLLSRYKSGPLPKAFKIIPSLPNWDAILYLTNPSAWTPHATLAATRILCSNLKPSQSQRFFKYVLLPKFREQVQDTGKVTPQIFEARIKAVYKPAAFFKGLLFPLAEAGCTLKEAAIMSAVLSRVSIPVLHSAAALLRLSEMHYRGPTSLFIRTLLDKKYALPYKVVDALVFHFLRFSDPQMGVEKDEHGEKRMPVLWHQSFLVFSQRYKQDLTPDQKAALLDLLRVQKHESIGADIRRELTTGHARGEMLDEPMDEDMDDAISI